MCQHKSGFLATWKVSGRNYNFLEKVEEMVYPKKYQSYFSRIIRNFRFFSKAVPSGVKVSFSKVLAIAIPFHLYISQLMDFRWDSIHWYHLY